MKRKEHGTRRKVNDGGPPQDCPFKIRNGLIRPLTTLTSNPSHQSINVVPPPPPALPTSSSSQPTMNPNSVTFSSTSTSAALSTDDEPQVLSLNDEISDYSNAIFLSQVKPKIVGKDGKVSSSVTKKNGITSWEFPFHFPENIPS